MDDCCAQCGKVLQGGRPLQSYCSFDCYDAAKVREALVPQFDWEARLRRAVKKVGG